MKKYRKVKKPPSEIEKYIFFLTKNEFSNFLQFLSQIFHGFIAE